MLGHSPSCGPAKKEGASVAESGEPRGPSSHFSALLTPVPPTHPQITRRYAEFSSAIVSINQTFPHERTLALLGQLQRGQLERLRGEEGEWGTDLGGGEEQEEGLLVPLTPPPCPTARVTQLVRGFAATWKASVETLSQDVMRSFTNFKNGTTIIQVGEVGARVESLPVRSELINIHHLMVEVKKHRPNF
ncbi:Vacuolar protein sorting-associated protein 52-like protein, partial [Ophiophagus hannah]